MAKRKLTKKRKAISRSKTRNTARRNPMGIDRVSMVRDNQMGIDKVTTLL